MVELYSPRSETELLILRSILDDAGLRFYIRNDTFASLFGLGHHVEAYDRKTICVAAPDLEEARALLWEFHRRTGGGPSPVPGEDDGELPASGWLTSCVLRVARWLGATRQPERVARLRVIRNPRPRRPAGDTAPPRLHLVGDDDPADPAG